MDASAGAFQQRPFMAKDNMVCPVCGVLAGMPQVPGRTWDGQCNYGAGKESGSNRSPSRPAVPMTRMDQPGFPEDLQSIYVVCLLLTCPT